MFVAFGEKLGALGNAKATFGVIAYEALFSVYTESNSFRIPSTETDIADKRAVRRGF